MEVREFKAKTVDEAITAATLELGISSDQLEYKVICLLYTSDAADD